MTIRIQTRPSASPEQVLAVVRDRFGVEGSLEPLPGERDLNFLLTTPADARYVVKISSPQEPEAVLEFETGLMEWLDRDGESVTPRLVPAQGGKYLVRAPAPDGSEWRLRVLEHMPGGVLGEVRPRTPTLLESVGEAVGTLSRDLARAPLAPPRRPDFDWALARAGVVMSRGLEVLDDPEQRRLVTAVEARFGSLADGLAALPTQLIHGDANDHNLLISAPGEGPRRVTSILDFGDAHRAPAVFDLAITAAYAVLGAADHLQAMARVVAGFHRARPLSEAEIALVLPLVRARWGASVAISAWRRRDTPEPDPYLLVSEAPAWEALAATAEIPEALGTGILRDACGLPASARASAVAEWLDGQPCVSVVDAPGDPTRVTVLDLSVASPLLTGTDTDNTEDFTRRTFDAMAAEGAELGIGRYGEPRAFYLTEAFDGRPSEMPERRTVHLGVDVFAAPGAEVRAPLPAEVVSVHDNAGRLDYGPTVILEHEGPDGPFWTLYGHLERASVAELATGTRLAPGEAFARVGPHPENGDWPPHLHVQVLLDRLGYELDFPGVAAPRERSVWMSFSPDPTPLVRLGVPCHFEPPEDPRARRERLLGPSLSLSYDPPIHVVRGRGASLFDVWGREYVDGVNNVAHVGHEHPRVVAALRRQAGVLNTNTRYLHGSVLRYAERLVTLLPDPLEVCWFVNSGSEANELALRMARVFTGHSGVVVLEGGYHGHTQGLVDVSHYKFSGPGGGGPPDWVGVAPMPEDYRGLYRRDDPARAERYAAHVREELDHLRKGPHGVAAFLCESLLSCGGQVVLPEGYLERAYAATRERGGVCIADEVQVGFGRVGSHMWGFQTQGVVPDIVTLGKPIGNGHPLGAVVTTRDVAERFDNGMEFFSTFGGNPVSAEVGLAVLDVLEEEALRAHAARVGEEVLSGLRELAMRHPAIGDARGLGLFLGVELVRDPDALVPAPEIARYAVQRMKEHGILLSTDGPDQNVIKFKPPMPFSSAQGARMVEVLDGVLGEDFVRASLSGP